MQGERRRAEYAVASGIVAGLCAATATRLYLSSTEQAGLAGLVLLPIVAAACAIPAAFLGYSQSRLRHSIFCALAAAATVTAALVIWQIARDRGGPPIREILIVGVAMVSPFAILGVLVGYAVGSVTFSVVRRT